MNKIKDQDELAKIIDKQKALGRTIGFTNGCFDILHKGHVRYLKGAKKECDILVVGVNSDASVKKIKGDSRPLNSQNDRLEVLEALECVDYLTLFEEDTPEKLIKKLTPDVLFKGGDWKVETVVGGEYVMSKGGKVKIIPYVEGYSTTGMISRMSGKEKNKK
ncbi:MAG: D-glycero-beta-D-manno-heptose 1-phosphate adenylyltransferase [Candidatus Omnitrophica bacterium]|nr:D-glycero-beta-D-manno-heptose 1-phosphate adenylyltransferase [Candidatus Omnitrophota bacterium]